jgi:hypothetical protein
MAATTLDGEFPLVLERLDVPRDGLLMHAGLGADEPCPWPGPPVIVGDIGQGDEDESRAGYKVGLLESPGDVFCAHG